MHITEFIQHADSEDVIIINSCLSFILMFMCKYSFLILPAVYAEIINYSFDAVFVLGILIGIISLFENTLETQKAKKSHVYDYMVYCMNVILICATTTTLIIPIILSKGIIMMYEYIYSPCRTIRNDNTDVGTSFKHH